MFRPDTCGGLIPKPGRLFRPPGCLVVSDSKVQVRVLWAWESARKVLQLASSSWVVDGMYMTASEGL